MKQFLKRMVENVWYFIPKKWRDIKDWFYYNFDPVLCVFIGIIVIFIGIFGLLIFSAIEADKKTLNFRTQECNASCESHNGRHRFDYPHCFCSDGTTFEYEEILLPITEHDEDEESATE